MGMRIELAVALGACLAATPMLRGGEKVRTMRVYVGGQSKTRDGGIHRFELNMATGELTAAGATTGVGNPSFLAIAPDGRFLYAVNERGRFRGQPTGSLSAFAIDPKTGDLSLLNQEATGGPGPCHLVVDKAGRHVLAANYSGGSACVLPVGEDGRLGSCTAFVQHEGSSVNPKRQKGPHAHSINLDAANRFAFVADLGLDQILIYRFDPAKGTLTPSDPPFAKIARGSGPRHFAFHPSGRFAYVINELASTVTAFAYDAERGALRQLQTIATLPEGFGGESYTAEIAVHPTGQFLYGSNRGHNSIAVFAIDADAGRLRLVEHESTQGDWPRHFGIDPTGTFLIAANRRTSNLVVFRIDGAQGTLEPTGHTADVPGPACVKFLSAEE
ncbi:MAG: lactonase family protein [Planctomycetota bacterium]